MIRLRKLETSTSNSKGPDVVEERAKKRALLTNGHLSPNNGFTQKFDANRFDFTNSGGRQGEFKRSWHFPMHTPIAANEKLVWSVVARPMYWFASFYPIRWTASAATISVAKSRHTIRHEQAKNIACIAFNGTAPAFVLLLLRDVRNAYGNDNAHQTTNYPNAFYMA